MSIGIQILAFALMLILGWVGGRVLGITQLSLWRYVVGVGLIYYSMRMNLQILDHWTAGL